MDADSARAARFRLTLRDDYERADVEAFLADARAELARRDLNALGADARETVLDPRLTPKRFKGYDPQTVDAYVALVADVLDATTVAASPSPPPTNPPRQPAQASLPGFGPPAGATGRLDDLAQRILEVQFTYIRKGGYSKDEVDALLERLAGEAASLGPAGLEIEALASSAAFTVMGRGGYDPQQVDHHLDRMMAIASGRPASPADESRGAPAGSTPGSDGLAQRILKVRFTHVRRGGYETREVDAFLRDVIAEAGALGPRSAEFVRFARSASFATMRRGGYDTRDVDAFLDRLISLAADID